jgi:hypothetical protein
MPAYVGNPLAGDPIWEASSASELRIAITTKQVSRAGHPSDLLVANSGPLSSWTTTERLGAPPGDVRIRWTKRQHDDARAKPMDVVEAVA